MKFWTLASLTLSLSAMTQLGCVRDDNRFPVGRAETTSGIVCPSGQEPSRNGQDCVDVTPMTEFP
ncbi:MAG: hypothetical protein IPG50_37300 [Myxococcales bacterium]|nr:hypothetical protein [Myxococcales bacterium]